MSPTNWTEQDQAPALAGVCKDGDTPVDLTAATAATAHIRRPDATIISRAVTRGAGVGSWSLAWDVADLNTAGTYVVEVEVTWPGGLPQTFPSASFSVARQVA